MGGLSADNLPVLLPKLDTLPVLPSLTIPDGGCNNPAPGDPPFEEAPRSASEPPDDWNRTRPLGRWPVSPPASDWKEVVWSRGLVARAGEGEVARNNIKSAASLSLGVVECSDGGIIVGGGVR